MELPNKKYKIIYADPAWKYGDKRNTAGKNNPTGAGGALKHYECMDIKEIKALKVDNITDKNCMLFLWTTSPFMKEAIEVIEAWGFKFITIPFVWIKMRNDMSEPRKDGIGNYTLNNAEYVLLGRKGKYWRNSTKIKQVLMHPKLKHSEKPDEIRNRIVKLCGDVPRIELFARHKREGWDVWGLEAPKETQNILLSLNEKQEREGGVFTQSLSRTQQEDVTEGIPNNQNLKSQEGEVVELMSNLN